MKFKKVILLLTENTDQQIVSQTVQLCKRLKGNLFVLFVIEPHKISRLSSLTHQKTETLHQKIEEEGWRLLYHVEDEAVEKGVRTSLHLENGQITNILKRYVKAYEIDVVLVKRKDETKKVFISSPIPVMGL